MAMNARQTVVGVFDSQVTAEQAFDALQNAGFSLDQIHYSGYGTARSGGFLESLKRLFTGGGSRAENDVGDFSEMGFSNEEARWYNDQYDAGRAIITVRTADRMAEAMQILQANGAYNYDMRVGTAGTTAATTQAPAGEYMRTTDVSQQSANYLGQPDEKQPSEQGMMDTPVTHEEAYIKWEHPPTGDTPMSQGEMMRVPVNEEQAQAADAARREQTRLGRSGDVYEQQPNADLMNRDTHINDSTGAETDARNPL